MTKTRKVQSNTLVLGALATLILGSTSVFAQEAKTAPVAAPVAAEQPVSAVDAPASPIVVAPAAAAKPEESTKKELPAKLAIGEGGALKISGLVQVWGLYQNQTNIDAPSDHASTFRLRRAEVKLSGELVPKKFSFAVMIDAAKTPKFGNATAVTAPADGATETGTATVLTPAKDNSLLQDAYVTYNAPWFDLSAGQFKTPVSFESATSSSKLLFPERAAVVRAYGEQRDLGVKLERKLDYVGFVLGAFNGAGINRLDDNNQKDVALRLEAYPIKGLTLGAVGYTSVGQRDSEASTKDRLEGDVALNLGDLLVQAEYIHGWNGAKGARVEGAGWYGAVGYTIGKVLQPVVRIGQLDGDLDTEDDAATSLELGVNYFVLNDTVKLQATYAHTGYEAAGTDALQEVTLAAQYKF